jgi:hypothetical protein
MSKKLAFPPLRITYSAMVKQKHAPQDIVVGS